MKSMLKPNDVVRILFATVALGMGIDLHNVNLVVPIGAPLSIDDYIQECGRIIYWKLTDFLVKTEPV